MHPVQTPTCTTATKTQQGVAQHDASDSKNQESVDKDDKETNHKQTLSNEKE